MTDLETFTAAYIETMYWADCNGDDGQPSSDAELAPDTRLDIEADCRSFFRHAMPLIEASIGKDEVVCGPTFDEYSQAGHDFYLTRNGHGAGFWDGDWPTYGDRLTRLARGCGEANPCLGDDGLVYLA